MKINGILDRVIKLLPIFYIFVVFLTLFYLVYPYADKVAYQFSMKSAINKSLLIQQSLQIELRQALSEAKDIVAGGDVPAMIEKNNSSYLPVLLDSEARKRNLTFLAAVNQDGVNLASIPISSNSGDYVFQTTVWGRAAAKGKEMTTIGAGNIFPLILVGAEPILQDGNVKGAVFAGYLINDDFAAKFKTKYLNDGFQVLFYSKSQGILGDSFSDQLTRNALSAYFNIGTDWIQKGQSGDIVQINNENYYVQNYLFPNPENIDGGPGGVLILLPFSPVYWYVIDSTVIFLIFLLLVFSLYFHFHIDDHRLLSIIITVILGLIILGGTMYYSYLTDSQKVLSIKPPPYTIYNSTIAFEPDNDVIDESAEQHIAIKIATGGETINAIEAKINYDPAKIQVANIVTANSICDPGLFVQKTIDNAKGVVDVICGIPNPGFAGANGIVAELLVQPIEEGNFSLNFASDTQVMANDGLGTNVLRQATGGSYQVENFANLKKQSTSTPPTVLLFSSTQPNSNRWYNNRAINLSWVPLAGYDYYYLLDGNPDTVPAGEFSTKENEINLSVKSDGVYYFHILAEKDGVSGPVTNYKIMVDDTPPPPPTILVSATKVGTGELVRFKFSNTSDVSGLQDGFYVKIDNSILFPSAPQLDIPFLYPGRHYLTLRVFDNAGNFSDATKEINVDGN